MNNPIYIEKAFQSLQSSLPGLYSKTEQLNAIYNFLQLLPYSNRSFDTYRQQLIPSLPEFIHVYEVTGLDPSNLEHIHQSLKGQYVSYPEMSDYLNSLNDWVEVAKQWVGKDREGSGNQTLSVFESMSTIESAKHTVLVPVVETNGQNSTGRLRNLTVKTIGNTPSSTHELTQVFSVLAGNKQSNSSSTIEGAVNELVKELHLSQKTHWQVAASFEHNDAWHSGKSADLAMAGLFFCAIIEAMELKEQFRLNPAVAITGSIDEHGNVLPVSEDSIPQKVEAAFYSWTQVLVVPQSQMGLVYQTYEELKEIYPNRDLLIIGVRHLRELFYDRRLTLHSKKGMLQHAGQKIWKRKTSVLAVLGYMLLAFIITALVIGPVDRNPDHFELFPSEIAIMNKIGRELKRIPVDPVNIFQATKSDSYVRQELIEIFDSDNDGKNEVLLSLQDEDYSDNKLILMDDNLTDTLWINELIHVVDYEKHPDQYLHEYRPRVINHADIDHDGELEIIATLDQQVHFQGHIWVIDAISGVVEQQLMNAGWFLQFEVEDIDEDGSADLIACGHYKGFEYWGCTILDGRDINGFMPLADRYWDEEKVLAKAKVFMAWDKTVLTKALIRSEIYDIGGSSLFGLRIDSGRKLISLTYIENRIKNSFGDLENIPIIMTFDYNLNPVSFASSDAYDRYARELYEKGFLDFIPDARYLHAFKDSLYYWNGTDWVQEPTLNPSYLESVGEDTTYYKEWYFRED